MLIFGPDKLQNELGAEFLERKVPHEAIVLGAHSADAGSFPVLTIDVGAATALATAAIPAWLTKRLQRVKVSTVAANAR